MKLYLFRHAEKSSLFSDDPDLTKRGYSQAQKLSDLIISNKLPRPDIMYSSPRKRAINSFNYTAESLNLNLVTENLLLERQSKESHQLFLSRISKFLKSLQYKNATIYACSHYDWVIEAMGLLPSDTDLYQSQYQHWMPLQYLGLEYVDESYKVIELGQIQP